MTNPTDRAEATGVTRWRSDQPRTERAAPDPDAMRKKAEFRAALAVDGENAAAEYEAQQLAVRANTARLAALRAARDADAPAPKKSAGTVVKAKADTAKRARAKPTSAS